jgi:hypothetical protein
MKIDLSKISSEDFEFLIEDLLKKKGFSIIIRPSRGPDLGKDIIAQRMLTDDMKNVSLEKYLVECKHFAISKKSVTEKDLKNITERIKLHNANRYLIATSTILSGVINSQLNALSKDESTVYKCTSWTKTDILELLNEYPEIKSKYFEDNNWNKQASELAESLKRHYFEAHRGAILYLENVTAVFGNDGFITQKERKVNQNVEVEIKNLREYIQSNNDKELGFGLSIDKYTWVILISTNNAREYNDIIWECLDLDVSLKKYQSKIAHSRIWSFLDTPYK